jgi:hypothetical protein
MVLEPSLELYNDMMAKVASMPSYTGYELARAYIHTRACTVPPAVPYPTRHMP